MAPLLRDFCDANSTNLPHPVHPQHAEGQVARCVFLGIAIGRCAGTHSISGRSDNARNAIRECTGLQRKDLRNGLFSFAIQWIGKAMAYAVATLTARED